MEKLIHHYTSIENLALILSSRKIRFNRMDKVDDLLEIDGLPKAFSTYVFISCWTYEKEESIPLWKMYTQNMRGVRLSLPIDMFKKKLIKAGKYDNFITVEKDIHSPLSINEQFAKNYFISNVFSNKQSFYKEVIYDNNYPEIYKKSIMEENNETKINNLFSCGAYKGEMWKFQNESRFTLYIIPLLPIDHLLVKGNKKKQFDLINYTILNNIRNEIEYFDLELDDSVVNNMYLKLGPLCLNSDKIIVDSLLTKFTKNGQLEMSNLDGKIRH